MPTACPATTWLNLIFLFPRQMRPQRVTTMVLSWKGQSMSGNAYALWTCDVRPKSTNLRRVPTPGLGASFFKVRCMSLRVLGQATLLGKPLKHRESVVFSGRRKRFTSEEKTAGMIGDGERITVLAIGTGGRQLPAAT